MIITKEFIAFFTSSSFFSLRVHVTPGHWVIQFNSEPHTDEDGNAVRNQYRNVSHKGKRTVMSFFLCWEGKHWEMFLLIRPSHHRVLYNVALYLSARWDSFGPKWNYKYIQYCNLDFPAWFPCSVDAAVVSITQYCWTCNEHTHI